MSSNYNNDVIDAPVMVRDNSSGRTAWDDRGNSVWEWQTAPGVYSRHADTQRVKALQMTDLQLEDTTVPGHERVLSVLSAKDYSLRAGSSLPERGKSRPQHPSDRGGLIKRLMGR